MRVAVSAEGDQGLESVVAPHFGRCPHYVIVELEGREVRSVHTVENPFYGRHQPGQVPGFIHDQGVEVMLTGGMGRRAIAYFQGFGVEAVTGAHGTVGHALQAYLGGRLRGAEPCKSSQDHHHGGHSQVEERDQGAYERDELGRLQEEIEALEEHLAALRERLAERQSDD
jgi:predicted Fe-Mo cluster-binding NifX family protein